MIRCLRQYQSIVTVHGCFISVIVGAVWTGWRLLQTVPTAEQQVLHHSSAQRTSPSLSGTPSTLQHHLSCMEPASSMFMPSDNAVYIAEYSITCASVKLVPNMMLVCIHTDRLQNFVKLVGPMCVQSLVQPKKCMTMQYVTLCQETQRGRKAAGSAIEISIANQISDVL